MPGAERWVSLGKGLSPVLPSQPAPGSFHLRQSQELASGGCQPFPPAALGPHQTPLPALPANAHLPSGRHWHSHNRPRGNPGRAGINSAEIGFSERTFGTMHEVVRYLTAPAAPRAQAQREGEAFPCPLLPARKLANSFGDETQRPIGANYPSPGSAPCCSVQ